MAESTPAETCRRQGFHPSSFVHQAGAGREAGGASTAIPFCNYKRFKKTIRLSEGRVSLLIMPSMRMDG